MKHVTRALSRWAVAAATLAAMAMLLGACGSSSGGGGSSSKSAKTVSASGKKITLVQLQSTPFYTQAETGFASAARSVGITTSVSGPPQLNPAAGVTDTQDVISAGTNGLLVSAFGSFTPILNREITQNVGVCTVDVSDPGSKVPCHIGSPTANEGAALAKYFAAKLGPNAHGNIVAGICVPGYPPLAAKVTGFVAEMRQLEPAVKVLGPFNVTGAPTTNQSAWQRLSSQNPGAIGFVGPCDQDLPSLVRMKSQANAHYLIGTIAGGDDPNAMSAIRKGELTAAINQHGYVDGVVGATLLTRHILHGTPLPTGWINSGFDLVTKANVNKIAAVVNSGTAGKSSVAAAYYAPLVNKILANPKAAVAGPISAVTKLGAASLSQPYPGP